VEVVSQSGGPDERRHASVDRVLLLRSADTAAARCRRRRGGPGEPAILNSRESELVVGLRDVMEACYVSFLRLRTSNDAARGSRAS